MVRCNCFRFRLLVENQPSDMLWAYLPHCFLKYLCAERDDMIVDVKSPKELIQNNLIEVINDYSKLIRYMVHVETLIAFLYTNNEQFELEMRSNWTLKCNELCQPPKTRHKMFTSPTMFPHAQVLSISVSSRQSLHFDHNRLVFTGSWPSSKWNYITCMFLCLAVLALDSSMLFLSVVANLFIHSPVDEYCFFS